MIDNFYVNGFSRTSSRALQNKSTIEQNQMINIVGLNTPINSIYGLNVFL